MDMLTNGQIAALGLTDWRKLGQGLHARYVGRDLPAAVGFLAAVAEAGAAVGHQPRASVDGGTVDLRLISDDAVYRARDGQEHVVEWVTQRDVDLAGTITGIAADHGLTADPGSLTLVELGLDTAHASALGPVWAALLTGDIESLGRGSLGNDVRDATGRVPILWFQETDEHETPRQRFHLDVWVAPEAAEERIAAAVAAGAVVVDDSEAPSFTVLADPDGNKACVCTSLERG